MPDPTPTPTPSPTPTPAPTPTPTPSPTPPWHDGLEAETIGFWQNKGYKLDDPKALAADLTKNYRELERHLGAGPDQILRIPKADAKPDEIKAFWGKLGAPGDAKDYDLSGIKMNGKPLDDALSGALRDALAQSFVPKDKGGTIAAAIAKHLESTETTRSSVAAGKLAEEKAALKVNWGPNFDFNHLKAMEGARRSGVSPEAIQAMEGQIGYSAVMEHFRKIGTNTSEDTFHERGASTGGNPTTLEGAKARLAELQGDQNWRTRFKAKDAATVAEWTALTTQIAAAG